MWRNKCDKVRQFINEDDAKKIRRIKRTVWESTTNHKNELMGLLTPPRTPSPYMCSTQPSSNIEKQVLFTQYSKFDRGRRDYFEESL